MKPFVQKASAAFAVMFSIAPAFAGPVSQPLSNEFSKCLSTNLSGAGTRECGAAEIDRQETRLLAAWKRAYSCFDAPQLDLFKSPEDLASSKELFLAEQLLWTKYKDASCRYYGGIAGTQSFENDFPVCRATIIAERVQYLDRIVHDEFQGENCAKE